MANKKPTGVYNKKIKEMQVGDTIDPQFLPDLGMRVYFVDEEPTFPASTNSVAINRATGAMYRFNNQPNQELGWVYEVTFSIDYKRIITITNATDGTIITHNLNGVVTTRFVDASTGIMIVGVYGEYHDANSITLRIPITEPTIPQITGKLICELI